MRIVTRCPNSSCNTSFRVDKEHLGRKIACPKCKQSFVIAPTVSSTGASPRQTAKQEKVMTSENPPSDVNPVLSLAERLVDWVVERTINDSAKIGSIIQVNEDLCKNELRVLYACVAMYFSRVILIDHGEWGGVGLITLKLWNERFGAEFEALQGIRLGQYFVEGTSNLADYLAHVFLENVNSPQKGNTRIRHQLGNEFAATSVAVASIIARSGLKVNPVASNVLPQSTGCLIPFAVLVGCGSALVFGLAYLLKYVSP